MVNLDKGGKLNLSKESTSTVFNIGLGWDTPNSGMTEEKARALPKDKQFDLDVMALMLDADGKRISDDHLVFYAQQEDPEKSVKHSGDNQTGVGEGDDETIIVYLNKVAPTVQEILFLVNMHEGAATRNQNFGQVKNAYAKLYEGEDKTKPIANMDLTEDYSMDTQVVFCRLYRHNGEWKYEATKQGKGKTLLADTLEAYGYTLGFSSPRI